MTISPHRTRGARIIAGLGSRILRSRPLMRAPIWLYRARLGWVFGHRMLLLEHLGRTSGKRREVVLEVFGEPAPGTYLVVSGFGGRAQWFRNVVADDRVRVTIGPHGPRPARARVVSQAEADAGLQAYITQRPRAWSKFKPIIEETLGAPIEEQDTALPVVALTLEE